MATSEARVTTDRPSRYAKQLVSHLARKNQTEWDQESGLGVLSFSFGTSRLRTEEGSLLLTVEGAPEDLDRLESVVGKHLVRFGAKDELVVEWMRDTGERGTVWRNESG
jgi:uncharacterized protein